MDQKYGLEDRIYELDSDMKTVREILYASSNPIQAKSIWGVTDSAKKILNAVAGPGD